MRGDSYQLQGQQGGVVLDGTHTTYVGRVRWIQVVNAAVLDSTGTTADNMTNVDHLCGITLPAGLGVGGVFTAVKVTSGVVIVYKE